MRVLHQTNQLTKTKKQKSKKKKKNHPIKLSDLDRTVVIEQPSHSCKLCGKSFWNRDSMYKHMNMHKGTTQCPVCHKVLSRTTHMKRHLKNRHGWMGPGNEVVMPPMTTIPSATTTPSTALQSRAPSTVSGSAAIADGSATAPGFSTIRIRESSVERITSSPIP